MDLNFADLKAAINTAVFTDTTTTITVSQRFANDVYLVGRNQANSADISMWKINTSNLLQTPTEMRVVTIAPTATNTSNCGTAALLWAGVYTTILEVNNGVAMGGGAAPTLGTIGGSGPASAGQNSWLKVKIGATDSFIPIWR